MAMTEDFFSLLFSHFLGPRDRLYSSTVDGGGEGEDGRSSPHRITNTHTCKRQRIDELDDHTDHNVGDRNKSFPMREPSP